MNKDNWLLDHTGLGVSELAKSTRFYDAALRPLNCCIVMRINSRAELVDEQTTEVAGIAFGADYPVFWIDALHPSKVKQHIAFRATSREAVDAFYREGLAAGGVDNGGPGLRPDYPPGYYAAFLFDPDGNNIEAVYREPQGSP